LTDYSDWYFTECDLSKEVRGEVEGKSNYQIFDISNRISVLEVERRLERSGVTANYKLDNNGLFDVVHIIKHLLNAGLK
jgi:hypothetical protein